MIVQIEIELSEEYKMNDVINAFHLALQLGEEELSKKELLEYSSIVKDIRKNKPIILENL